MSNQAEINVAIKSIDDVMDDLWKCVRENDFRVDSDERVEAILVVDVTRAHTHLINTLKRLRESYRFYSSEKPVAVNEMSESDLGIDFGPSIEQLNKNND